MRILGIDPGTTKSGFAIISEDWREKGPLSAGVLQNEDLLAHIDSMPIDAECTIAIEMISSYGMRVGQTTFDTCVFIGRLCEVCYGMGIEPILIKRHEVKKVMCPGQKSNDSTIRLKLIEEMGWTKENIVANSKRAGLKSHAWQALAVAVAAERSLRYS